MAEAPAIEPLAADDSLTAELVGAGEDRLLRLLRSPLGALLARPWLDRATLAVLARGYLPLSRLWAAANIAEGSVERFAEAVPLPGIARLDRGTIARALADVDVLRLAAADAERAWTAAFFGEAAADSATLAALERARSAAAHRHMAARRRFARLLRHDVPLVRWAIPAPAEVEAVYGRFLAEPAQALALPESLPAVRESRALPTGAGRASWLRFRSPAARLDDEATASVLSPEGVADPPTLIFDHGIGVEAELWRETVSVVQQLVAMGVRVVQPTLPWHGRRTRPGSYGGEPFLATAPLGALDLFASASQELAVLVGWARASSKGRVAIGGVSLGALIGQLVASRASVWPAALQPDAAYLVTHSGSLASVALDGVLSRRVGVPGAMARAGWTEAAVARWLPLIEPGPAPALDPARIVSVLGTADEVTPYDSGAELARRWRLPRDNVFVYPQGHFSMPVWLVRHDAPLRRLLAILRS
jgi:pimeloyl-ACP methyl ester carboxylesterase